MQKFCDTDILEFRQSVDMSDPRNTEYHISGVSLETDLGPVILGFNHCLPHSRMGVGIRRHDAVLRHMSWRSSFLSL